MNARNLVPIGLGLLFSVCTLAAKVDLAAEEKAILKADGEWLAATLAHDAAGQGAALASDGVVYREHEQPIVGPAAYQAWIARMQAKNPKMRLTWTVDKITVAASGDLAIETGQYQLTGLGPTGDFEDKGRFITVWKKEKGAWKVAYDVGSTTVPATEH